MQRLRHCRTGAIVADRISRPTTAFARTLGYLLRNNVEAPEGLWFDRCSAIHTVGMRARIDVVFLDDGGRIVRLIAPAPANRLFAGGPRAVCTLELAAGVVEAHALRLGDRLQLE